MAIIPGFSEFGRCKPPDVWNNDMPSKLNRLYYIYGGTGGYICNGKRFDFEAKRLYLLPAFAGVHVYTSVTDKIDHTYASFELIPPILSKEVISIDPHARPEIESALNVFRSLCKNRIARKDADMEQYLKHTCIYLSYKIAEENGTEVLKDASIIRSLELIHEKMSENITIAEIAESIGMSTDGFIRKFKSYIDQTPYEYLRSLRTRAALKMRELGEHWDVIAEKCGYADQTSLLHAINAVKNKK